MKVLLPLVLTALSVACISGLGDEAYEYSDDISELAMKARRTPACDRPLDIVLVTDDSSSMGSVRFNTIIKPTLENIVELLKNEGSLVRMGHIAYYNTAKTRTKMSSSYGYLKKSVKQTKLHGGMTNLGQALCEIDKNIKFRSGADRAILILSRGNSNRKLLQPCKKDTTIGLAKKVRKTAYILSIGMDWDIDHKEVKSISDGYLTISSSDVKKATTQTIQYLLCKAKSLPEQPTRPLPHPRCSRPLDVMFAIDTSAVMGYTDFRTKVISLMNEIIDLLPRNDKSVRLGYTIYGSRASIISNLETGRNNLAKNVKRIPYRGGKVNLPHAICMINEKAKFRPNADKYVIIISKGKTDSKSLFPCYKKSLHSIAAELHKKARVIGYSIGKDHVDVKKASTEVNKMKSIKELKHKLLGKMKYLLCY